MRVPLHARMQVPLAAVATMVATIVAPLSAAHAQSGRASNGWVGISVIQTGRADEASGLAMQYPVVAAVEPGSPAQTAGVVAGDTILAYNAVDAQSDPLAMRRFLQPGERLVLRVRRNGVRDLPLTVAKRSPRNSFRVSVNAQEVVSNALPTIVRIGQRLASPAPLAGAQITQLTTGLANLLDVTEPGVLVLDIAPNTAAMTSGLTPGDVIVRANNVAVPRAADLIRAIHGAPDHAVSLDVIRRGKPQKITLRW